MSNDSRSAGGAFSELLRLQTEFQARLVEETLHYLRRVQGAAAPASPGTVVVPQEGTTLTASGAPGAHVRLLLEIENRQRVHCVVTPMLGPLVSAAGVTWFPEADSSSPSSLLAPGQVLMLDLTVPLPADLPADTYRGVLLLQGFSEQDVAVAIEAKPAASPRAKPRQSKARATPARSGSRAPRKR